MSCCLAPYLRRRRPRLLGKLGRAWCRLSRAFRRRRMCVEAKDSNDNDKVVSAIIGYFTARVTIRKRRNKRLVRATASCWPSLRSSAGAKAVGIL